MFVRGLKLSMSRSILKMAFSTRVSTFPTFWREDNACWSKLGRWWIISSKSFRGANIGSLGLIIAGGGVGCIFWADLDSAVVKSLLGPFVAGICNRSSSVYPSSIRFRFDVSFANLSCLFSWSSRITASWAGGLALPISVNRAVFEPPSCWCPCSKPSGSLETGEGNHGVIDWGRSVLANDGGSDAVFCSLFLRSGIASGKRADISGHAAPTWLWIDWMPFGPHDEVGRGSVVGSEDGS